MNNVLKLIAVALKLKYITEADIIDMEGEEYLALVKKEMETLDI